MVSILAMFLESGQKEKAKLATLRRTVIPFKNSTGAHKIQKEIILTKRSLFGFSNISRKMEKCHQLKQLNQTNGHKKFSRSKKMSQTVEKYLLSKGHPLRSVNLRRAYGPFSFTI